MRYWDKAGTVEEWGKYTAGVLIGICPNKDVIVRDIVRGKWGALDREKVILQAAAADTARFGSRTAFEIWVEQEPGSGGKESAELTIRNLQGFTIHADRVTGNKLTRASPLAAQAEAGNVYLIEANWNEAFLSEAHSFTGAAGNICDQIDAASGSFNQASLRGGPAKRSSIAQFQ